MQALDLLRSSSSPDLNSKRLSKSGAELHQLQRDLPSEATIVSLMNVFSLNKKTSKRHSVEYEKGHIYLKSEKDLDFPLRVESFIVNNVMPKVFTVINRFCAQYSPYYNIQTHKNKKNGKNIRAFHDCYIY